ncbi:FAD binding domain-containing protein [Nitratireductor sp. GCM10026969]|uniref:FAD binding domain-containing protein n=1 Tax=Nitratireductor sp. GCM10026969 TaxID=3252645 RepID=UPI003609E9FC
MRPSEFEYHKAESLEQALALLQEFGDEGRPIAGGQSLVPMMNLRLARPAHLVDINGLGLDGIEEGGGVIRIGALVRHETYLAEPLIIDNFPAFIDGVHAIGHPTIRRNGTIGGSLAHSDPTAELPLLCMLHDGEIIAASAGGERRIPATQFFEGAYMTVLEPGEMIVAVELPVPPASSSGAFVEMAERRGDFAIAACGVTLEHAAGGVTRAAVACSGAGQTAMRAPQLEEALEGLELARPDAAAAIAAFTETLNPPDDHSASADYRRALIGQLVERALSVACSRAMEAS